VELEKRVRAAEPGAALHDLLGAERPADDSLARVDLEREAEAPLRHHGQSGVPVGLNDRRAVRPGMRERAVDREKAGLGRGGVAADREETVEAGEMSASGLVEEDAGRCRGGRDPDCVGQRVQALSDASESFPDVAERPVPAAHGREYRNRLGRGQRGLSSA
jgi:hypothetical protein